jgi:hypothetical protein
LAAKAAAASQRDAEERGAGLPSFRRVIAGGRAAEPKPPGLSLPSRPNDLSCADYKGEFMLADRRYSYPV